MDHLGYVIPGSEVFKSKHISSVEVKNEISKAKDGKSAGVDKISNKLLKSAGDTIIDSLTFIFNLSLNTGIFPEDLKYAKGTPIYNSENRKDCRNYFTAFISQFWKRSTLTIHNRVNFTE